MTPEALTRKVIEVVLSQGTRLGLDVAGGFLGPAWPFLRPLFDGVLKGIPAEIAKRYKSSREAAVEAAEAVVKDEKFVAQVSTALTAHGVTAEWLETVLAGLERVSDDVALVVSQQAEQGKTLAGVRDLVASIVAKQPARVVIQSDRIEYVDYLALGDDPFPGMALIPGAGTLARDHPVGRHMPAGFLIWNFMLMNDGGQLATVVGMTLDVLSDIPAPGDARAGGVRPLLAAFEQDVNLAPSARQYPLFLGKRFKYAPEADVDVFRVRLIYALAERRIQQLRLVLTWRDGTGEHLTYGEPLFLASLEKPQLGVAAAKFGYGG